MTKMWHAWEVKVSDRMRDLLGDAQAARKKPVWIPVMFWEQMIKYWESPEYKAFCERNKRNRNEGRGGRGVGKHTSDEISQGLIEVDEATISGGLSRDWLYGAGSEAAHLRVEKSRVAVGLPLCFLEAE
ncbi:hypothetical protein M9H77_25889 [Catharanthus roseus]|uniref:Uncharacterized protein n=1 Tax=Catharanthus roseus TaxID=4058 RepID=A0ACC0A936_CATRO|nr:hypothetical protein M9H77_25889 [Catharanthus roseus]